VASIAAMAPSQLEWACDSGPIRASPIDSRAFVGVEQVLMVRPQGVEGCAHTKFLHSLALK